MLVYAKCTVYRGVSPPPPTSKKVPPVGRGWQSIRSKMGAWWFNTGWSRSCGYRYHCALPLYNTLLWPLDRDGRFTSPVQNSWLFMTSHNAHYSFTTPVCTNLSIYAVFCVSNVLEKVMSQG